MASTNAIKAGQAFVEILGDDSKLAQGLKRAQAKLRAFGAGVKAIGVKLAAAGGAVLGAGLFSAKEFADAGSALVDMAHRTGVSAEALSELSYAAAQTGTSIGDVEKAVRKMQKTIVDAGDGLATASDALARLGLSADDLRGLAPEDQFELIGARLAAITDPTLKAATALEIFGRSGTSLFEMLPVMSELRGRARELGLVLSNEDAAAGKALGDAMTDLLATFKAIRLAIGGALASAFTNVANVMATVLGRIAIWIREHRQLVVIAVTAGAGLTALGTAAIAAGYAFIGLGAALGGVVTILGAIGTALAAIVSPVGIAVAAMAGLGAAILHWTGAGGVALNWLKDQWAGLSEFVGDVVSGISDALAAGDLQLAAEVLWIGLRVAWEAGTLKLREIWEGIKRPFVQAWYDAVHGALVIAETVWHGLQVAWIETTSFIADAWQRLTSFLTDSFYTVANVLAKVWNWVRGLFDETFDVAAANLEADLKLVEKLDHTKAGLDAERARIEAQRQGRRDEERRTHEATLSGILDEWVQSEKDVGSAAAGRIADARAELEEAKKALDAARTKAREAREAKAGGPEAAGDLQQRLAGAATATIAGALKLSVAGTFNPAAVAGLGGGGAMDKIERNTRAALPYLREIADREDPTFT